MWKDEIKFLKRWITCLNSKHFLCASLGKMWVNFLKEFLKGKGRAIRAFYVRRSIRLFKFLFQSSLDKISHDPSWREVFRLQSVSLRCLWWKNSDNRSTIQLEPCSIGHGTVQHKLREQFQEADCRLVSAKSNLEVSILDRRTGLDQIVVAEHSGANCRALHQQTCRLLPHSTQD